MAIKIFALIELSAWDDMRGTEIVPEVHGKAAGLKAYEPRNLGRTNIGTYLDL